MEDIPKGVDRVLLHGYPDGTLGGRYPKAAESLQHTLITDLTEPEDEIKKKFKSNTRNEINRALKDGVKTVVFESTYLRRDSSILGLFGRMYKAMYEQKGMKKQLNLNELYQYIKVDSFLLSAAYIEDKPMVFHSYVTDGEKCRLLQSCNEFRMKEPALRSEIGRANRLLQWEDMLYFKTHGCLEYDWGGVFSYEGNNGIDSFKRGFGGTPRDYYNIILTASVKAKAWDSIKKMIKHGP